MDKIKKTVLLSTFLWGWGQFFHKYYLKGIILFVLQIIGLINIPFVLRGIGRFITLGEKKQIVNGFQIIQGDHSIFFLVDGIIIMLLIFLFILIFLFNIRDAAKIARQTANGKKAPGTFEYLKNVWSDNFFGVVITPGLLGIIFFILLPMLVTVAVSFTNYSAPDHIPPKNLVDWVGLTNFTKLFQLKIWNKTLFKIGIWTIVWAISITFLNYVFGLILAMLTSIKHIRFRGFWRTIFILPYAIPPFVSLLIFRLLFNGIGPVNNLLQSLGLSKIPFLSNPLMAKVMVLLINSWTGAPYFMVLLSGALTNVSSTLYEASSIDGASKWTQFWKITLPILLYQTAPILILTFAFNFNNFGAIYLLTDGDPKNSTLRYAGETDIFISWVYKLTVEHNQFNMAAVISIMLFLFVATIAIINFSNSRSFKEESMI